MPITLTLDVTEAIGSGEQLTQVVWVFLPDEPAESLAALVCLPGGTYDKRYWHLEIEGHPGYRFGEDMARAGYIVIAVDHLAVGDSTDPIASGPLGLELLAAGDAEVARQVRKRLQQDDFVDRLAPTDLPVVGVGHSMGACLTTMVQASTGSYDAAVVLLGYGVQITNVHETMADAETLEARIQQRIEMFYQVSGAEPGDSHGIAPRDYPTPMFYAGEVPQVVIDADTAAQSRVPVPGRQRGHHARVRRTLHTPDRCPGVPWLRRCHRRITRPVRRAGQLHQVTGCHAPFGPEVGALPQLRQPQNAALGPDRRVGAHGHEPN